LTVRKAPSPEVSKKQKRANGPAKAKFEKLPIRLVYL